MSAINGNINAYGGVGGYDGAFDESGYPIPYEAPPNESGAVPVVRSWLDGGFADVSGPSPYERPPVVSPERYFGEDGAPISVTPLGSPSTNASTTPPVLASQLVALNHLHQSELRSCGTTCLAMILSRYTGKPVAPGDIDREIRRGNVGTPSALLVAYAREHGLAAERYNHGSWATMKSYLDRGLPCMAMVDASGAADMKTHYMNVVGYEVYADGSVQVKVQDPADLTGPKSITLDRFLSIWHDIRLMNTSTGYDNFFMVMGPTGTSLPPSDIIGAEAINAIEVAGAQILNGIDLATGRGSSGWERFEGVSDVVGGAVGGSIATPGLVASILGQKIGGPLGDLIQRYGATVAVVGGAAEQFIEDTSRSLVNAGQGAVQVYHDLISGDFSAIGRDLGRTFVDPIADQIHAIEHAGETLVHAGENLVNDVWDSVFGGGAPGPWYGFLGATDPALDTEPRRFAAPPGSQGPSGPGSGGQTPTFGSPNSNSSGGWGPATPAPAPAAPSPAPAPASPPAVRPRFG